MLDNVVLGDNVVGLGAAALVAFLVFGLLKRGARKALFKRQTEKVAGAAGSLAFFSILQSIALIVLIAAAVTVALSVALSAWLGSTTDPNQAQTLSTVRLELERILSSVGNYSTGVWIASLAALGAIWAVASFSLSNGRWKSAVEARRSAIRSSLSSLDSSALQARLVARGADNERIFVNKVKETEDANRNLITLGRKLPVAEIGSPPQKVSLDDLVGLREQLRSDIQARKVEGLVPEGMSDEDAQTALESIETAEQNISALISDIEDGVTLPRKSIAGTESTVKIGEAERHIGATEEEAQAFLVSALVDLETADHDDQAGRRSRREPELLREWVGTAATSEAAVKTSSTIGRLGGFVAALVMLLGTIGFSAQASAPQMVERLVGLELDLLASRESASLEAAISAREADAPDRQTTEAVPEDLAEDDETEAYVRAAFRASIARDLSRNIATPATRAAVQQGVFRSASTDARRAILSASTRQAAVRLDRGAPVQRIASSVRPAGAAATEFAGVLDDSMDRNIRRLRRSETVWTDLRRQAARPARTDFAANAFMRTALGAGSEPVASTTAMRAYSRTAANDFATQLATGQSPETIRVNAGSIDQPRIPLSVREQRLVADFKADAPNRVTTAARSAQGTGSLQRRVPSGRTVGAYETLFPPASSSAGTPGATPRTSGGSVRAGGSGGSPRLATRSFSRMRLSGRIGGVLIGREPSNPEMTLDVTQLAWRENDRGLIEIQIGLRDKGPVSLGVFHPAIVHHAMAYAADGRVIALTMPKPTGSSDPDAFYFPDRRIVAHPAFEDTRFACSAQAIDTFVDAFTFGDTRDARVRAIEQTRFGVNNLGGLLSSLGSASLSEREEFVAQLMAQGMGQDAFLRPTILHSRQCGTGEACFPIDHYTEYGIEFGSTDQVLDCFSSGNLDACWNDIGTLSPKSSFLVDSGVRESAFEIDESFSFLRRPAPNGAALTWSLDFMIQAVPQSTSGDDLEAGDDWDPWEFPTIASDIRDLVAEGVRNDRNARTVMDQLQQFTVLQRLFRTGLDGYLGHEFPIGELVNLQEFTASAVIPEAQPRWNISSNGFEILADLNNAFGAGLLEFGSQGFASTSCQVAINTALANETASPWPEGTSIWMLMSDLEDHCGSTGAISDFIEFRDTLRDQDLIDAAVRLSEEWGEVNASEPFACEPL